MSRFAPNSEQTQLYHGACFVVAGDLEPLILGPSRLVPNR